MTTASDHELLVQFSREESQDAFTALVNRHLNLVYWAALRQVHSPDLAGEVSQTVFTHLAANAARLRPDTILTAWLHQVTRRAAIDVVRREARRQVREQIAIQMRDMNNAGSDWAQVEPLLDEAVQALDETDRTAVLLRYFENKSLREVGEAIGASEDAARKRVSRALERLRVFFGKRKVTVSAGGLAVLLSAHAVQAAPAGLAGTVAMGAAAAMAALATSAAIGITKTIAMTMVQKSVITLVVAGAATCAFFEARRAADLRRQVEVLQGQQQQYGALSNRLQELQVEHDRAANALAHLAAESAALKKNPAEMLRLRGQVSRLRQENTDIAAKSPLSKVTADAESRKALRDAQKQAMEAMYKGLARRLKLTPEQSGRLADLMADHVLANFDHLTTALRDKAPLEQTDRAMDSQEAILGQQMQELLGADGLAQFQEYNHNLLGYLSIEQFASKLTGSEEAKQNKSEALFRALHEASREALAAAGLPADYPTLPMYCFRNIASPQAGEQGLNLLDDILQRAAARAGSFLTPEELAQFQEFRTIAVSDNRNALTLSRAMAAPTSK